MADKKQFLEPINSTSVVQKVIDRITGAIVAGELKPGDKIPTEPELVESFQIGRNSIREAIRVLVAYGVLEIRRAEGTFVCDGFSSKMINPALYGIILQKENSYKDLIGLRKIIENGIMQSIMENKPSASEWEGIEKICNELVKEIDKEPYDVEKIADKDIAFHNAIANATNNNLVMILHDWVIQLSRESRYKTIEKVMSYGDKNYLINTHQNLLRTLKGNNIISLDEAIKDSYFYWKDIYK